MKPYDFKKRRTSCLQPKWAKYILCFLLFLAMHPSTFAKEAFSLKIRRFLNPISFNIASGFGINYYENTILGLMIFDQDGNHYLVDKETDNTMYLVRWMGQPYIRLKSYDNLKDLLPPKNLAGDKVVFSGTGMTFPINLSAHIDILKKVRLELGGSLIINKIKTLQPDENHEFLDDYVDPVGTHYVLRPFILLGFKVLENSAYTLLLNTQISYDWTYSRLSDKTATYRGLFPPGGLGITLEKHISEYFSIFSRIMYEAKNHIQEILPQKGVLFTQQAVYLQLGLSLRCPEIPRCPIKSCDVEVKHKHRGKSYRGVSMFTGKDSKGERLYEK